MSKMNAVTSAQLTFEISTSQSPPIGRCIFFLKSFDNFLKTSIRELQSYTEHGW